MTEYPGVLHAFDDRAGPPWTNDSAPTSRGCDRVERDGVLFVRATGLPFTWDAPCVEHGVSGGYDEAATAAAKAGVTGFLKELFALP
jgi:hypothetical protein